MDAMIDAAIALGLDAYGVSDHWTLHPDGTIFEWSMRPDMLGAYLEELEHQQSRVGDQITVIKGLEVDWFPDHGDAIARALEPHTFDVLIASVHFVGARTVDESPAVWQPLTQAQVDDMHRRYWELIQEMADSRLFDVAAHLDLPKKFGFLPAADLSVEINRALDAIAASGMVVELNTAGWFKTIRDAYPTPDILRGCRDRDIRVTLSSDAHRPEDITRAFVRGAARLREAGYNEVARFAQREITMCPLDDAVRGLDATADVGVDGF